MNSMRVLQCYRIIYMIGSETRKLDLEIGTLCGKIKLIMWAKIGKLCGVMRSLSPDDAGSNSMDVHIFW